MKRKRIKRYDTKISNNNGRQQDVIDRQLKKGNDIRKWKSSSSVFLSREERKVKETGYYSSRLLFLHKNGSTF